MSYRIGLATILIAAQFVGCAVMRAPVPQLEGLMLELRATEDYAARTKLAAVFKNVSPDQAIGILKPTDGGPPKYRVAVRPLDGQELSEIGLCGMAFFLWQFTTWPDDYLIELAPGDSAAVEVYIPGSVTEPGRYRFTVEYSFRQDSALTPNGDPWPEGLWEGRVRSRPITLVLRSRR